MKKAALYLSAIFAAGLIFGVSCGSDDDDDQIKNGGNDISGKKGTVNMVFKPKMGNQELEFDKKYTIDSDYQMDVYDLQFFLSDIYAVKENGQKERISEIEHINFDNTSNFHNISVQGEIPVGSYTSVEFGSGVKQDLNERDPAEYGPGHPLNTSTGMYWTWNTNFIFQKLEGRVYDTQADTSISWFFHTGLNELYRPGIKVERTFAIQENMDTDISIILDFEKVLESKHKLDLWNYGQSHTTDAKELATQVSDNFSRAFE